MVMEKTADATLIGHQNEGTGTRRSGLAIGLQHAGVSEKGFEDSDGRLPARQSGRAAHRYSRTSACDELHCTVMNRRASTPRAQPRMGSAVELSSARLVASCASCDPLGPLPC
eukprot:scaffold2630_cov118-Isochrysis_galbana.AAC.10